MSIFFFIIEQGMGKQDEVTHIGSELRGRGRRRQSYKRNPTHLFKSAYLLKRGMSL